MACASWLNYAEKPIAVLERRTKTLRNKEIGIVKESEGCSVFYVSARDEDGGYRKEKPSDPLDSFQRTYERREGGDLGFEARSFNWRLVVIDCIIDHVARFEGFGVEIPFTVVNRDLESHVQASAGQTAGSLPRLDPPFPLVRYFPEGKGESYRVRLRDSGSVNMGRPAKKGKKVVTEEDQETLDLREMIAAEVGEALHDMLPGYLAQMKEELTNEMRSQVEAAVAAKPGGSGGSGGGQLRVTTYKDFSACQPPQFNGQKDPVASSRWISEVEGAFLTSSCSEEVKVRYASNLLRKAAKDWWNLINRTRTLEQIATMTWEQFKELFKEQYVPQVEVERLTGEFLAMKQTTETMNKITNLFLERSLFCPDYVASERMKMYVMRRF
ncbi:hypothetical protein OSB04_005771 [Centaurea solstitialis]|uniref:Retrotransposon gag domain-containing protein n=1 Tax=Centaurea solstitialis TaxID=347529 RepID=A0AA38TUI5_9ASTR|nr:hypothetical protein OSB04_005771 [Centaurea solstitialis]